MTVLFLIFFLDQICPKWIKLDQTGFPHQSKNVNIKVVTFTERIKMAVLFLIFFWIRSVQNGSNLIKLDQIGFPHQSKNVTIKSCHIYRKDKNGCFVFEFFLDQICPKWIKLDQIGFLTNQKMLL